MLDSPLTSLVVEPLDVGLELTLVDTPHASPTDLYRREITATDERVHLLNADAQVDRDVLEGHEAGFKRGRGTPRFVTHLPTVASRTYRYMILTTFASV
jgi:hypothetical protein